MKPCHTCLNRRFGLEHNSRTHVGVWRCTKKDIRLGYQWQYDTGESMPDKCQDAIDL